MRPVAINEQGAQPWDDRSSNPPDPRMVLNGMFRNLGCKEVISYLYPTLSKIGKLRCLGDKVQEPWSESKEEGVAPTL